MYDFKTPVILEGLIAYDAFRNILVNKLLFAFLKFYSPTIAQIPLKYGCTGENCTGTVVVCKQGAQNSPGRVFGGYSILA